MAICVAGIICIEDDASLATILRRENMAILSHGVLIRTVAEMLTGREVGDEVGLGSSQRQLIHALRTAIASGGKCEGSGRVLQTCSLALCDDREDSVIKHEINRRLHSVESISDWSEEGLVELMGGLLGPWMVVGRLLWESLKRLRRGVPGGGRCRRSQVVRREEWQRLWVRRGSWVCPAGFWAFRRSEFGGRCGARVGEDELEVIFEVVSESLVRVFRACCSWVCGEPCGGCVAALFSSAGVWIVDRVRMGGG
jgi:hypothetical protein